MARALQEEIGERVRAQYEAFPYPDYGLYLPLRSQEAYASNSLFAARILEQHGQAPALRRQAKSRILLAGCGDVFPYMATFWEPRSHSLVAADLSARSLRRARLRCLPRFRALEWRRGNLEDPGFWLPGGFSHVDSYGMLHHMAGPAAVLGRFGRCLAQGGTARIMVYNSDARRWIRHLQRAFDLLGLSAFERADLDRARKLLERAAAISPALRERFAPMRDGAFANPARFVDVFLHAREARLPLEYWLGAIADAGLEVIGLFDRYGELDDLANPLLEVPQVQAWRERIDDRRFENNLELFLAKPGPAAQGRREPRRLPSPLFLRTPPRVWFSYDQTRSLPWMARLKLWNHFLARLAGRKTGPADAWAGRLPPAALQRLSRIGALFPDDFRSRELQGLLRRPIHAAMEPPDFSPPGPLRADREIRAEAEAILREKALPARRLEAVMARLEAAQQP